MLVFRLLSGACQEGASAIVKRKYITIPFGKKDARIRVILCRKPMGQGLAGMVRGKGFANDLAILLDKEPSEEAEYLHAALVGSGDAFHIGEEGIGQQRGVVPGREVSEVKADSLFYELGTAPAIVLLICLVHLLQRFRVKPQRKFSLIFKHGGILLVTAPTTPKQLRQTRRFWRLQPRTLKKSGITTPISRKGRRA